MPEEGVGGSDTESPDVDVTEQVIVLKAQIRVTQDTLEPDTRCISQSSWKNAHTMTHVPVSCSFCSIMAFAAKTRT